MNLYNYGIYISQAVPLASFAINYSIAFAIQAFRELAKSSSIV
ncbi:hypothetical protein N9B85_00435 [bacterium]|nr:hypothetical protein [bacterium]